MGDGAEQKTVALVRCDDYDGENVYLAVKEAIDLIGGPGTFVSPGRKVFLKFNLLQGSAPGTCVTTHPAVVHAVARILKEHGCSIVMGDSPGSGQAYTEKVLRKNYAAAGYDTVSRDLGIPLNYDTGSCELPAPEGRMVKRFLVIAPVLDADAVVVVSKAKTHTLTWLSAAAKNLFGVIPGFEKPFYHGKMPDRDDFCSMIVDLNEAVRPKLQIVDAIMAMEGDGPHSGTPRKIGAVLASGDYTAIDVITARLMAYDPGQIGTIRAAAGRGLVREDFGDVVVVGDDLSSLVVPDLKHPSTFLGSGGTGGAAGSLRSLLVGFLFALARTYPPWPRIRRDQCTGCLKCVRSCPKKTITVEEKRPVIGYRSCIRCYCCHEMCDSHAISLERGLAGKVIAALMRSG